MSKYFKPYINLEDWKRNERENIHHIYPTSRWWANVYDNKVRLYQWVHDALHRLFGNGTPQDNIKHLVNIVSSSLTQESQHDLYKILSIDDNQYRYKKWIRIPWKDNWWVDSRDEEKYKWRKRNNSVKDTDKKEDLQFKLDL